MRYVEQECSYCKTRRVYYEDYKGGRASFLQAEGWQKVGGCWICDECAEEL